MATIDTVAIKQAISQVFVDGNRQGWVLAGYEDRSNHIVLQGSGFGKPEEVQPLLREDEFQYVMVRIPDQKDDHPTVRDILIGWQGPKVKIVERGKKNTHFGTVKAVMSPVHATLTAVSVKNFNEATIRQKFGFNSGSHMID
eukprot:TRINITY_DN1805_c0_g1_i1.p1 TRINITY_DN1805_c0_g1~~TRINITY_DN1805_c0_g1_i1.p1  ORF type:complete len:142 (-),score=36.49 TRINITY_DN1805_c0_g1_i1:51-476(-)